MSRVLVTGGTGFIGSWVVRELVARGCDIRIFDLKPRPEVLDFVAPGQARRVEIVSGDITDRDAVFAAVNGCDAIVHLVGLMTVDCRENPQAGIAVNLTGSQHVFDAAAAHGVTRVAYASTGAVYGPDSGEVVRPMSLYGVLKLALEGVARVAFADHGISSAGFRPYIVYGAGESAGIAAGPSIALQAAARGKPATIRFSGKVGFVHVSDVAGAFAASLTDAPEGAHVYDLAGDTREMSEFLSLLKAEVPGAQIAVEGPPLRMPETYSGGDRSAWFDARAVTALEAGILQSLGHWNAALQQEKVQA